MDTLVTMRLHQKIESRGTLPSGEPEPTAHYHLMFGLAVADPTGHHRAAFELLTDDAEAAARYEEGQDYALSLGPPA